jgi:hypothetical protein
MQTPTIRNVHVLTHSDEIKKAYRKKVLIFALSLTCEILSDLSLG